ncbi:hypothetical protein [Streptomyces sp. NBC_00887]|uniref:hypothetical protein n=1 Tax=Streptomyces sp. NBC_00887 TaxID=2975859 RepID=UPI00386A6172|nr:hypothetical protein OG844_29620 [Streptomyces sp. NBC_00887]
MDMESNVGTGAAVTASGAGPGEVGTPVAVRSALGEEGAEGWGVPLRSGAEEESGVDEELGAAAVAAAGPERLREAS